MPRDEYKFREWERLKLIFAKDLKEKLIKITDEYAALHEDECYINAEGGSIDGCECLMLDLVNHLVNFIQEDREYWMKHLVAHEPICLNKKQLTEVKKAIQVIK